MNAGAVVKVAAIDELLEFFVGAHRNGYHVLDTAVGAREIAELNGKPEAADGLQVLLEVANIAIAGIGRAGCEGRN